ncbi:MAG: hypothetical protein EXR50_04025 [Dehalococcoidia bacterium]|nr:hypothetical protein [Dehalococcoidia bacterium]
MLSSAVAKLKVAVGIMVVLATLIGGAYFIGMNQKSGEVSAANKLSAELQQQVKALNSGNQVLNAKDSLHRSLVELDKRNFGTANSYVREAEAFLREVNPNDAGLAEDKLQAAQKAVEATNLIVVQDVGSHRADILALVSQLDKLVSKE